MKKTKLEIELSVQAILLLALIIWHPVTLVGKVIAAIMAITLLVLGIVIICQKWQRKHKKTQI